MRKKLGVIIMIFSLSLTAFEGKAQKRSFEGVMKKYLKNSGVISKGDDIVGYYQFYKLDKADKRNNNYQLTMLDENLNLIADKKITASKTISLQESVYNGLELVLKFYDWKEKDIIYYRYNMSGELVKKSTISLTKDEATYLPYSFSSDQNDVVGLNLFPAKDGFINYQITKPKKMGFKIEYFSSTGGKNWKFNAKEESKKHVSGQYIGSNDDLIVSIVTKLKNPLKMAMESDVLAINAKTGKEIYSTTLTNTIYSVQPVTSYLDENNHVVVLGLYFDKDNNTAKSKNLGLAIQELDEKGNIIKEKYSSWEKDLSKFMDVDKKGKIKDIGYLNFHNMIKNSEGEYFIIGEEYKKVADGFAIAAMLLNSGNSAGDLVNIRIDDLHIFKFDKDFNILDTKIFEKSKSTVDVGGLGFVKGPILARYLDYLGYFDYSYTEVSKDKESFTVTYIDFDSEKVKVKDRTTYFGMIKYKNGEYKTERITLSDRKSKNIIKVSRAKKGYIMISEYNRKEESLEWRLEKL